MELYNKIDLGNVLITGSAGWLGNRLLKILDGAGNKTGCLFTYTSVTAIVKNKVESKSLKDLPFRVIIADLKNHNGIKTILDSKEFNTVINLAGIIHPTFTKDFIEINQKAVTNIVQHSINNNVKSIVVMSSNSPFGFNKSRTQPFTCTTEYNAYQNYGISKMHMEISLEKLKSNSSKISVIRSPWFYGPCQPERQIRFFKMIKNGQFPEYKSIDPLRSLAYLDNIIQGIFLSIKNNKDKLNYYWVADQKAYKFSEIINTVKDVMRDDFGLKVSNKRLYLPKFISPASQIADRFIQNCGFYNTKIHVISELGKDIFCDIGETSRSIDYFPKVQLAEGMRISIEDLFNRNIKL